MSEEIYRDAYIKVQNDRTRLIEQNKRHREAMKRVINILKYVPSEKTPKKDAINALQDALKGE